MRAHKYQSLSTFSDDPIFPVFWSVLTARDSTALRLNSHSYSIKEATRDLLLTFGGLHALCEQTELARFNGGRTALLGLHLVPQQRSTAHRFFHFERVVEHTLGRK